MPLRVLLATALLAAAASVAPQGFSEKVGHEVEHEYVYSALDETITTVRFELEHQVDVDAPFTSRGVVEIGPGKSSSKPVVSFSALSTLSSDDTAQLEQLLRQGRHYIVRVKADPDDPESPYAMTAVPMCMLAATQLREHFAFHLSDSGKLLSIEYLTPYLDPETCAAHQTQSLADASFDPIGTVLRPQNGPSPPKKIVIKHDRAPQGVKPVHSEDDDAKVEPQSQSFLRKYWYVILPIVVMSLFGGNGGDAPAGGAPAGGAPAPVAAGRRR